MADAPAGESGDAGALDRSSDAPRDVTARLTGHQIRAVTQQSPLPIALISLDGMFLWVNDAYCRLLGRTAAEVIGAPVGGFVHPDDRKAGARRLGDLASGREFNEDWIERYTRPDGSFVSVRVYAGAVLAEGPRAGGVQAITIQSVDISGQIAAEDARLTAEESARRALADLRYRSTHDTLTGLLNRRALLTSLDRMLAETKESGEGVAVLFCDLDNLKEINDGVSHEAGDAILIQLADSLKNTLRSHDLVGRVGGDEFVVVLRDVRDAEMAGRIAEQIRDRAGLGLGALVGLKLPSGVSIGVRFSNDHVSGTQMLRDADAALHEAKATGRNQIIVFDDQMQDRMEWMRQTRTRVAVALEHRDIHAWFQPIVDLRSEKVVGYEALARWVTPERVLDAWEWIGAVAESPLISKVGEVVVAETIQRLAILPPEVWIAVNVSAREIGTPIYVGSLMRQLEAHGVSPDRFIVEVTESVVMDRQTVRRSMDALVNAGIQLHFDDFGTGYASLNHLHTLPVSGVKLDRSFTTAVADDGNAIAIVRGIAGLAGELGLSGVAEGIETPAQAATMREAGWRYGQGYLYGHAIA